MFFNKKRKERRMKKPYVVSADVYLLMKEWAMQRGFVLPDNDFFSKLRDEFYCFMTNIFPSFELVPEVELAEGIARLISESGLTPVSLDRVYFQGEKHLDITRLVDYVGLDLGLWHRPDTLPLMQQFRNVQKAGLHEVVLVDDVVFTGELIERIIRCLSQFGIRVPLVCAGIGIAEGICRIGKSKCEIRCVRTYEEVIDEVCERDFYPGVPFSGRLLAGVKNIGVPYLLPFGNPAKWASIPSEWQVPFSRFCIQQTIHLFEEIEKRSGKIVSCAELGRMVRMLPQGKTRFVDALRAL